MAWGAWGSVGFWVPDSLSEDSWAGSGDLALREPPTEICLLLGRTCVGDPRWDPRHKGPFAPWLHWDRQKLWQSSLAIGWAPQWALPLNQVSNCQTVNSPILPFVSATESPFLFPNTYKRSLNSDWDEMVFRDTSLPFPQSVGLLIVPCSDNSSSDLLALSCGELGLGNTGTLEGESCASGPRPFLSKQGIVWWRFTGTALTDLKNKGSDTKRFATTTHALPSPFLEQGYAESFQGI